MNYLNALHKVVCANPKLTCYNFLVCARNASNRTAKSKRYSKTLNLPSTSFPLSLRSGAAANREIEIQKICAFDKLYNWQQDQDREHTFVLHDGPPYANGKPHVGHSLNKILKDITNRYKVMRGYKVHYVPGWDCHGLPIELKAVKQQKELSPLEIRQKAEKYARQTIREQRASFQRWGVMADWSNYYTTLDKDYQKKQWEVFYSMYEKGLIYQDYMPVYWSPSSRTALAEAELEYQDNHVSKSVNVKFPLDRVPREITHLVGEKRDVSAVVWTTTPWTLPFNQAICFGLELQYSVLEDTISNEILICEEGFSDKLKSLCANPICPLGAVQGRVLENHTYRHPLTSRRLPFLEGGHVTSGKGTGLVHTAPAHGHEDFQLAVKYGLPVECEVDEDGRYLASVGPHLAGKRVGEDADDAVMSLLGDKLLSQESYTHSYPYDWRTKQPVIIRASKQWFVNTEKITPRAVECLKEVKMYPPNSNHVMMKQLGYRTYWCISRQRVWGLPIPVFYHRHTMEPLINRVTINHLQNLLAEHGSDFWWTLDMSELLPDTFLQENGLGHNSDYVKGEDILDIWFDSGTSWASQLKDVEHQADVYLEGVDQYGAWFQTSLLTSVALNDKAPYRSLVVHGFTLDEEGKKMSKSVGNVVNPAEIISGGKNKETSPAYGADIMRWWVAHAHLKANVMIGPNILDRYIEEIFVIRKSLRFLLGNVSDFDPKTQSVAYELLLPQDKYMLHLLYQFAVKVESFFEDCRYNLIPLEFENFIAAKVSRFYSAMIKDRVYCGEKNGLQRRSSQTVQFHLVDTLVRILAPILPHLAEDVYQHLPNAEKIDGVKSVFRSGWSTPPSTWNNNSVANLLQPVFTIRDDINKALAEENPVEFDVAIVACQNLLPVLKVFQSDNTSSTSPLSEILQLSHTAVLDHVPPDIIPEDVYTVDGECQVKCDGEERQAKYRLILMASHNHICERCRRYTSESATSPCARCLDIVAAEWED